MTHSRVAALISAGLALLLSTGRPSAGTAVPDSSAWAPDRPEPGSVEAIREHTTEARYLPATVAYLPVSDTVPSPAKLLGRVSGAPDALTGVEDCNRYMRALAAASPRVELEVIGRSEEGRDILLVLVSSQANLQQLDRHRETTARLADPRRTDASSMEALVREGKAFYHLTGGLHSTETGSPEMLMELAYRLAVSEQPDIRAVRENLVVLITPILEVDGRDRVVQWYERHLRDSKLSYEEMEAILSPPYWGHYTFHDNNRDGMQLTTALNRAVGETFARYHPIVVHDLHESVPLLYISPGHGPYSRALDPLAVEEWALMAHHEASRLAALGLPGVWTWGFWDGWWPGYVFSIANNRNALGRFYETFGNGHPGTFERKLKEQTFAGKPVTELQWYRPWPPDATLRWSLRDNVNYMQAGALEALSYAARHREELLRNFWIKGNRAVDKGRTEAPFGWIFGPGQRDPGRLALLVNQLLAHGIEVHRLEARLALADTTWPAGSYVVRMDQPYRNAAVNFLEEQRFPADEANIPYDDVAWTWPILYGVEGRRADDRKVLEAPMEPLAGPVRAPGRVEGDGDLFLLRDTGQTALLSARVRLARFEAAAAETAFSVGGIQYPAGSWILRAPRDSVIAAATELGLSFRSAARAPSVRSHPLDLPRLAVYHTWVATQDCGWARYALDRAGMPYALINDEDLKRGDLGARFDVILFPDTWGDFAEIVHGIDPRYGPLAYTQTAEFPSHGVPDGSPDITGGMGLAGLMNLQGFVRDGGLLLAIGNAGTLAVQGGIVRDVEVLRGGAVSTPGSALRARVLRPGHPVAYGFETAPTVFRGHGPLFAVEERHRDLVVLQFGTRLPEEERKGPAEGGPAGNPAPLLLSGGIRGEASLEGKPAILDLPSGKGRVVLFAFDPLHRYLTHAHFRYVFNAILNWNDLPGRS